ncbi:MAG: pyrroline-5-carboxylate reductase [Rhodospirillales bacterium]|nr:pyrroline-5-carboxylate reductase [Rhodospirillales bacterium]
MPAKRDPALPVKSALPPILLVGCGRMGGAMLAAWLEHGLAPSVVVDPVPRLPPGAEAAVTLAAAAAIPVAFAPAAVVLAVKPQQAEGVLPAFARFAGSSVFLSIMAGRTLGGMQAALGPNAAIVRAMPNTPAAIRAGMSVACAGPGVDEAGRRLSETLLAAVGRVAWVEDEALLDPVTAVSGSGPAYVFLLGELLERAGIEQGLPADLARLLARRTIAGAGALLEAGEEDAAALRAAVTSPGGTTERALSVLMDERAWPSAISRAVAAATERSRELSG